MKTAAWAACSILLAALLWAGCGGSRDIPEGTVISLIYSSEVRGALKGCGCAQNGGGIAVRSAMLKAERERDKDMIYCDAGNFLSGTPQADSSKGQVMVQAYNRMQTAVANVSERELAFGAETFKALKKDAKFEWISANLSHKGSPVAPAYTLRKVKEARVAFIGLCGSRSVMRSDSVMLGEDVVVEDPMKAARRVFASLEGKADVYIILSTCGDAIDSALAQALPQADLIVGGRSYRENPTRPWTLGNVRVVRPPHDGRGLGRVDLAFGPERKIKTQIATLITTNTGGPEDAEMIADLRKVIPDYTDSPK